MRLKTQGSHSSIALALGALMVLALLAVHIGTPASVSAASNGKAIFDTNCSTCHGSNGSGQPGVFPPLAANPDVNAKDPKEIIGIVKHGLSATKTILGKQYHGGMPAWTQLSNADIAAVLTYVRSSWGNKAPAVTEAQVAAVK